MSSSEKPSHSRVALAVAIMCVAALFAVAMVTEWWPIIVIRSPARIASYHFGSESMVGHGGWKYSNPEVYAWTAFAEAIAATATLPTLWMIVVRRSRRAAFALAIICAVYAGSAFILGQINWATRETLLPHGSAAEPVGAVDPAAETSCRIEGPAWRWVCS